VSAPRQRVRLPRGEAGYAAPGGRLSPVQACLPPAAQEVRWSSRRHGMAPQAVPQKKRKVQELFRGAENALQRMARAVSRE